MKKDTPETKLLDSKKQIILYGPPGTGKTFGVKEIIENHSGEDYKALKELGRVEFITFHQSYSYEEFIEGIKPSVGKDGNIMYGVEDGILKRFIEGMKKQVPISIPKNDDLDRLIDSFVGYIKHDFLRSGKEFPLDGEVTIKEFNSHNSFITGGSNTSGQTLCRKIIKRDFQKYLDGKIKNHEDILPTRKSEKRFHGNSQYYFQLYKKLKEYKEMNNTEVHFELQREDLNPFYLVIDEINRGNISKIFGELITLLEADKRLGGENEINSKLPYSKKKFGIPPNLYIIATMNTSDKSIVSLDTALRRRFGFVEMLPRYDLKELQTEIEGIQLGDLLYRINQRIEYLLDKDHLIGQSYFLNVKSFDDLKSVFYNEIIPLLEEYFYGDEDKLRLVLGEKFFEKDEQNFVDIFGKESQDFDAQKQKWKLKARENITIDDFKVCFKFKV